MDTRTLQKILVDVNCNYPSQSPIDDCILLSKNLSQLMEIDPRLPEDDLVKLLTGMALNKPLPKTHLDTIHSKIVNHTDRLLA